MLTTIVNGILAITMVMSITSTTVAQAQAQAKANEATTMVMRTVFHEENEISMWYYGCVYIDDNYDLKLSLMNEDASKAIEYSIDSVSATYLSDGLFGVSVTFVTDDGVCKEVECRYYDNFIQ